MEKNLPKRKPIRLKHYDYSTPGAYFITICTHRRMQILSTVGAIRESPLQGRSIISKVIGYIKMNASKAIHREIGEGVIWQRLFHDHVIRNYDDYVNIANYIIENPNRWQQDRFYCENG